ncbi:hypothetical protein K504DRAFT_75316 [Pleomassaria siparia CBS 279.74]|uniref:Uncharacterized protein n=1 Tax=Pleomassaria siparia CBS 279.74 TaxID=1314801 RepID=A0A6G1K105_9PLEO|nr:hypothetical protein K504DRAFT_75316 [Pleomassaria siparia CBS 279.74]
MPCRLVFNLRCRALDHDCRGWGGSYHCRKKNIYMKACISREPSLPCIKEYPSHNLHIFSLLPLFIFLFHLSAVFPLIFRVRNPNPTPSLVIIVIIIIIIIIIIMMRKAGLSAFVILLGGYEWPLVLYLNI